MVHLYLVAVKILIMDNIEITQAVQSYDQNKQLMSVIRSTSCNRGWLRLVVQVTFGFIIVSSFIMILKMTICKSENNLIRPRSRCLVEMCRVVCHDAPMYNEFEDHIIHAIGDTDPNCGRVFITLNRPMFINSRMPSQWLSAVRIKVTELQIVGGNLQHISADSFLSQFGGNLRILVLKKISLNTLASDTFLGLSNLQELHILDCNIVKIRQNSVQAIDDTLKLLKIRITGTWDPANVTGSAAFEQLRVVDLSRNDFYNILRRESFTGLKHCRILYLSWCKINSIGAGTFDSLESMEILHLNNNNLVTLPSDLFNKIIPLEPRISLQKNSWQCDCSNHNLRMLTQLNLLIVDPTCHYPSSYHGKSFSEFEKYCNNDPLTEIINEELYIFSGKSDTAVHEQSEIKNTSQSNHNHNYIDMHFPLPKYKCSSNKVQRFDPNTYTDGLSVDNHWLSPKFFVQTNKLSMISLSFSGSNNYSLIWYQSSNTREIYCINHTPNSLKVFDVDLSHQYTFCLVSLSSGSMRRDKCVVYDLSNLQTSTVIFYKSVLLLVCIAIICLLSGALCVYGLIHRNPILLKGNKRVVFVKHKTVDALILPPKIPLRCDLPNDLIAADRKINNIFVIPENCRKALRDNFLRTNSVRTNESNDPSYVSALQPTEDQLAEWRVTHQLDIKYTYDSLDSDFSEISRKYSNDSLPHYSFDNTERINDTVKIS